MSHLEALEERLRGDDMSLTDEQCSWVLASVYDAYDLAWQLQEVSSSEPDTALLQSCIRLVKVSWITTFLGHCFWLWQLLHFAGTR